MRRGHVGGRERARVAPLEHHARADRRAASARAGRSRRRRRRRGAAPRREQAVGEAAGRGADVEAALARRIDAEIRERAGELLAAARDEARRLASRRTASSAARACRACRRAVVDEHAAPADQRLGLAAGVGGGPRRTTRSSRRWPFNDRASRQSCTARGRSPSAIEPEWRPSPAVVSPCSIRHRAARAAHRQHATPASASASSTAAPKPPVPAVLLDGDERAAAARERDDARRVERLHEARVHDRRRDAVARRARPRPRAPDARACRSRRSRASSPSRSSSPSPIGQRLQLGVERHAEAVAARDSAPPRAPGARSRSCSMCCSSFSSFGAMHDHVRQRAQVGEVVDALVRRAVGADEPRAIEREGHGEILQRRRRGRPGRRRAAGTSSRSPRTGFMPSVASPAANVTACCSAMPTS